jgi:hypothetical protein
MRYQLVLAVGTTDPATGLTSFSSRPAGAVCLATKDANDLPVPLPQAALSTPTGPSTLDLATTVSLTTLQALPATSDVVRALRYDCSDDRWNNGDGGTVQVYGLTATEYSPVGIGLVNGAPQLVSIDVAAATYVPFAGGGPSAPARDPFDVDTLKRKAVVDANSPLVVETDSSYYGKEFGDDVYGPGQPAYYKCMPFAPAQTGGATVWKWARIDIL